MVIKKPLTKIRKLYGFKSLKQTAEYFGIPYQTARHLDRGEGGKHAFALLSRIYQISKLLNPEQREVAIAAYDRFETRMYLDNLLDFLLEIKRLSLIPPESRQKAKPRFHQNEADS